MSDLASAKLEASLAETCAQVQSLCTEETEESDAILKIAPIKSNLQPDAVAMTIPMPPTFPSPFAHRHHIKRTLAAAFRVFSQNGFDEAVAGHITARDPISPTHFWVNPFGMHFACIRASDLILVDSSAHVVAGGKEGNRIVNTTAFMIHSNIHERRKDVNCAAHAHTIYGRTWASTGRPLEMITQDACAFYKDHVVYDRFGGVILGQGEGRMIADALGNHKAAILRNHGLFTVGETIEACTFWFMSLEKCCHSQLLADAAAGGRGYETVKIGDGEAAWSYQIVGTPLAGWFSGQPVFQKLHKEQGHDFDDEKLQVEEIEA